MAGLSGSGLVGRRVDPGRDPPATAAAAVLIDEADPLAPAVWMFDPDGPEFWIGVLVWVERYTMSLPFTVTCSEPFFSSLVSISALSVNVRMALHTLPSELHIDDIGDFDIDDTEESLVRLRKSAIDARHRVILATDLSLEFTLIKDLDGYHGRIFDSATR